jgi:transcriptional regulator with XRE-family HTH domain
MPNEVLVGGGAQLRAIRKERGSTQEQLAELTKLSTRHIAGIEKGEANCYAFSGDDPIIVVEM